MVILGKRHFYSLETLSFHLEHHHQILFLGLFRNKKPTQMKFQFWTKPMG